MSALKTTLSVAIVALFAVGCSDESSTAFQPNVVNQSGTFSVQADGLTDVSDAVTYRWENPETTADINQSGVVTAGNATLTVIDADNVTVYTSHLDITGTFATTEGTAGTWQVQLIIQDYSGDLDFSLQSP